MNYTDFVDSIMSDYSEAYDLDESMAWALYENFTGWILRVEDELYHVDEHGYIIDTIPETAPGALVWAATESMSLILGG
jgi:hypothetical protein